MAVTNCIFTQARTHMNNSIGQEWHLLSHLRVTRCMAVGLRLLEAYKCKLLINWTGKLSPTLGVLITLDSNAESSMIWLTEWCCSWPVSRMKLQSMAPKCWGWTGWTIEGRATMLESVLEQWCQEELARWAAGWLSKIHVLAAMTVDKFFLFLSDCHFYLTPWWPLKNGRRMSHLTKQIWKIDASNLFH